MSSSGDNGDKPPVGGRSHLTLVTPPGDTSAPRDQPVEAIPTEAPPSALDRITPPPRVADKTSLQTLIEGRSSSSLHVNMLDALRELANPRPDGSYDITFRSQRNGDFRLIQEKPEAPIRFSVTQTREGKAVELIQMSYLPDGTVQSNTPKNAEAHPAPQGPEKLQHHLLRGMIAESAQRIILGQDLYVRLRASLEALKGRYTPDTQSAWYEHFVAHQGKAYTFRIRNLLALSGVSVIPQLQQISVYQETGSERIKILTLSATGEKNYDPQQGAREPLNHQQLDLLKRLVEPLESARVNPDAYQRRLQAALQRIPDFQGIKPPEITRSVDISPSLGSGLGPRGEPILEFRSGKDLFRNFTPFSGHRWQNPENTADVRRLAPSWRLSGRMFLELMRWVGRTTRYGTFGRLRSPKPAPDLLRLHLFPEGGGQVTLFREGNIHDIIISEPNRPLWRAAREIRLMAKQGQNFSNRLEALQAALARRTGGIAPPTETPLPGAERPRLIGSEIFLQEAPQIDLNRIHLNSDGSTAEIRNAQTVWERIQQQMPPNIQPRVRTTAKGTLLNNLLLPASAGAIDRISVDFRESQPHQFLEIRHHDIPVGEGTPIRRVEIILKRGEDTHARVYEDGSFRPDIARDIHRRILLRAQEGKLPVSRWALAAQALPRIYGYYKTSGATYGLSYFGALPFILGYERLIYNEAERTQLGTPIPRLSLKYFIQDFSIPFMTMGTASGVAGVVIDGLYNMRPGIGANLRMWRAGATWAQALRLSRPNFFNPSPHIRPVGHNLLFRGFLQRSIPLFAGMVALEALHPGAMDMTRLIHTTKRVGAVSLGSAGLLRLLYASDRLASRAMRLGLIESAGVGAGASRWALTFRGGLAVATLELVALGIWNAHDKRSYMAELENAVRDGVGQAIDRRNELITRLEHGEEILPRHLLAADQELLQAVAVYRRFLEKSERVRGSEQYTALDLSNDFQDVYQSIDRYEALNSLATSSSPIMGNGIGGVRGAASRAVWQARQEQRLRELRQRYERMEADTQALYAEYGVPAESVPEDGLREFLRRKIEAASSGESAATPVASPISVESSGGRAILEQFRWKATQDPTFVLWDRERRADYILRQFRGYRVRGQDGRVRPWNQQEALAFLDAVDHANAERAQNMEAPLTLPDPNHQPTPRLNRLFAQEQEIRERERASHSHIQNHSAKLAHSVEALDRQMEAYYRMSNERTAVALESFIEQPALAMRL